MLINFPGWFSGLACLYEMPTGIDSQVLDWLGYG